MGKLQTGRFERLSARTYSIKGPGALVDLDETVLGVILLERQGGMESHIIQEWGTYGTLVAAGPAAAQFTWVGIANPIGSNQIIVLDRFVRDNATLYRFSRTAGIPPGFTAVGPGVGLDTRIPTARAAAAQIIRLTTNIANFGSHIASFSTTDVIEWPVVISEDGTFLWRSSAVNETVELSIYWAEREAAPFELT